MNMYKNILLLGLLAVGCFNGMELAASQEVTAKESRQLQVVLYERALHAEGVRTILNQTTPEGTPYSYLVGNPDNIIDTALTDGRHRGHVLYDDRRQQVAGFVVCSQSHNRSDMRDKKSEWWYINWLALHQHYQGTQVNANAVRSNATLLWNQVVCDATEMRLPIMLNTRVMNKRMQDWCARRNMQEESAEHSKFPQHLKYYSYHEHLKPKQEKKQDHKESWLYRYRYPLGFGIAAGIAGCLLFAEYKYRSFTAGLRVSADRFERSSV